MIIDYIENNLGKLNSSWILDNPKHPHLQCVKFEDQPFKNVSTYSTLGLSNYILRLKSEKEIRQELLFSVKENLYDEKQIASFMLTFAEHIIDTNVGLLRGEVIGPGNPIIDSVQCNSIYAAIPIFFGEDFYVFEESDPPTVFVWLLPILENECLWIKEKGWSLFEKELEKKEVESEFWDLNRRSFLPTAPTM